MTKVHERAADSKRILRVIQENTQRKSQSIKSNFQNILQNAPRPQQVKPKPNTEVIRLEGATPVWIYPKYSDSGLSPKLISGFNLVDQNTITYRTTVGNSAANNATVTVHGSGFATFSTKDTSETERNIAYNYQGYEGYASSLKGTVDWIEVQPDDASIPPFSITPSDKYLGGLGSYRYYGTENGEVIEQSAAEKAAGDVFLADGGNGNDTLKGSVVAQNLVTSGIRGEWLYGGGGKDILDPGYIAYDASSSAKPIFSAILAGGLDTDTFKLRKVAGQLFQIQDFQDGELFDVSEAGITAQNFAALTKISVNAPNTVQIEITNPTDSKSKATFLLDGISDPTKVTVKNFILASGQPPVDDKPHKINLPLVVGPT